MLHTEYASKLKDTAFLVEVDDGGFIVDLARRCYYDLSASALSLARLLEHGATTEDLEGRLVADFEVDAEAAAADVARFTSELKALQLVEPVQGEAASRPRSAATASKKPYSAPSISLEREVLSEVRARPVSPVA